MEQSTRSLSLKVGGLALLEESLVLLSGRCGVEVNFALWVVALIFKASGRTGGVGAGGACRVRADTAKALRVPGSGCFEGAASLAWCITTRIWSLLRIGRGVWGV